MMLLEDTSRESTINSWHCEVVGVLYHWDTGVLLQVQEMLPVALLDKEELVQFHLLQRPALLTFLQQQQKQELLPTYLKVCRKD